MAEAQSREQESMNELAKLKDDWDDIANKLEKSGIFVVELWEAVSQAKKFVVDELKSTSKFLKIIEDAASKYFGKGFDFCK